MILAAYFSGLHAGFTYDNATIVRDDPRVHHFTLQALRQIFTADYWSATTYSDLYRPVTTLSFLVNSLFTASPPDPFAYHVVNLLLHYVNALLVAALVGRLSSRGIGLMAAAVFAVHPLTVESVTNLVGRADLLAAMAMLLGLHFHLNWIDTGRQRWLWALSFAAVLAVFSKETGVMLPGLILAWDVCLQPRTDWWRKSWSYAALVPSWLMFWSARLVVFGESPLFSHPAAENPLVLQAPLARILSALSVQGRYLGLFFWPDRLSCDYSFDQIPLWGDSWAAAAWLGVLLAAIAVIFVSARRNRPVQFFSLAAAAVMLPTSNLLMLIGTIMAERFTYLPVAFIAAVVALTAKDVIERMQLSRFAPIGIPLVVTIILILAARTIHRNKDWRDDYSLWKSAVQNSPGSYKALEYFSKCIMSSEIPRPFSDDAALDLLLQSQKIIESDRLPLIHRPISVYAGLAQAYGIKGDNAAAATVNSGTAIDSALPWYERGLDACDRGLEIEALVIDASRRYRLNRKVPPQLINDLGSPILHVIRAKLLMRVKQPLRAIQAIDQARRLSPAKSEYHKIAAQLYEAQGDLESAAVRVWQAIITNPDDQLWPMLESIYAKLAPGDRIIQPTPAKPVLQIAHPLIRRHLDRAMRDLMILCRQGSAIPNARVFLEIFNHEFQLSTREYEKLLEP